MSRRPHKRRRVRALLGLLTAVLAMLGTVSVPATAAAPKDDTSAKIEPAVTKALAGKDNTEFWVMLKETADLSAAARISDWDARGAAVVNALRQTADRSQAGLRAQLEAQKATFKSFYIVNAVVVHNGTSGLAESLAKRNDVASIVAPREYTVPKPSPGQTQATINAVEWGIAAIHADQVWSTFHTRGRGITVANVDTGVDYLHPALVGKYRGNNGDGTFDHNYNWFDPGAMCSTPAPCDNNGHGTHTMGTMVGSDGANEIGVAPEARWIAAAGCCPSAEVLVSAGQWILAPTDLNNANARPELRPNIVNNSWGSTNGSLPTDPFYKAVVQAWRASGIFPAFSNGNSGRNGCESSGSPGDYSESYAAGAFDINGNIADFSSRGPGETGTGLVKPNVSAPGVDVRSSEPGGVYAAESGTSMASPHVAGTVALMWSAAPELYGDVARTEALLGSTAVDTSDLSCGGTDGNNNVWGEGKLDALAAVDRSPRGTTGTLTGTVTDAATGNPLSDVAIHVTGALNRETATRGDGKFSFVVSAGDYSVSAAKFGYVTGTATGTVADGQTTTVNVPLALAPRGTVSGHVRDGSGAPAANARVELLGTPVAAAIAAADGSYSIPNVPAGAYQVKASGGGCYDPQTQALTVSGDVTLDFALPNRHDTFGNTCALESGNYVEGDTPLGLTGDDASTSIDLPFGAFFYGKTYTKAHIATNGHINFLAPSTSLSNVALPATGLPNAAIYAFWDDLVIDSSSQMNTKLSGTAPNREFVVEWRNANFFSGTDAERVDFEAVLSEAGDVSLRYRNVNPVDALEAGNSATIGIENATGTDALQYSFNAPALSEGLSVRFKAPPSGAVAGTVTDFNDGQALAGASVRVRSGADDVGTVTSGADGTYRMLLMPGQYTVDISKPLYTTASLAVTSTVGTVSAGNAALHTPRAALTGGPLTFLAQAGQLRTATLNLASTSDLDLNYSLTSSASWLWTVPGSVTVPAGKSQPLTVRVDPVGLATGVVYHATIDLTTNAGRTPTLSVPVTLVVPAYRTGVDAGGTGAFTDAAADAWVADQAWSPGGFGYLGPGFVESSKKAIAGTNDDQLYQTQRTGMAGYRFDNLPAGTYTVELDFAELRPNFTPGKRVFDVSINGTTVLPGYDVTAAVGVLAADRKTFTVTVPANGSIEVFFGSRKGKQPPIINSLRLTQRPDM